VFDEAQRAFDPQAVKSAHDEWPPELHLSEPAHFIRIAERIPDWSVVVGLLGEGQEIHVGEEAGVKQWKKAIEEHALSSQWTVHGPDRIEKEVRSKTVVFRSHPALNLDTEMRFHLTKELHDWVARVLSGDAGEVTWQIARRLNEAGYRLLITRELNTAKQYVLDRYEENEDARFGVLASSKDKDLMRFGIRNGYLDTREVKLGPWYGAEGEHSCRRMIDVVTEFGAQGLELDFAVLAWGTDLRRQSNQWTNEDAGKYKKGKEVKDPFQLRKNSYRVLLTRGRDGTAIFLPQLKKLDETFQFLVECGCKELKDPQVDS
jgi:DUF2075 family protein